MNIYDNMAYGLRNRSTPGQRSTGVKAARILAIEPIWSVGRASSPAAPAIAMGRAIVPAQVFLFDRPLSNSTPSCASDARRDQKLQRSLGVTAIYVATRSRRWQLSGQARVMNAGRSSRSACRQDLPQMAGKFVATFIGSPPMNILPAWSAKHIVALGDTVLQARPA